MPQERLLRLKQSSTLAGAQESSIQQLPAKIRPQRNQKNRGMMSLLQSHDEEEENKKRVGAVAASVFDQSMTHSATQ